MSESYTMDDYIKENIIDKYNFRKTDIGYQIGMFSKEYGNILIRKDEKHWFVASDARILFYDSKPNSIIYAGYTSFHSIALVTRIIDMVNDQLKEIKTREIEWKKKQIEKDFEDETL